MSRKRAKSTKDSVEDGEVKRTRLPKGKLLGGDNQYELKNILAFRETPPPTPTNPHRIRMVYFLVEWKGYSLAESTWEPYTNLDNSHQAVIDFLRSYERRLVLSEAADGSPQQAWTQPFPPDHNQARQAQLEDPIAAEPPPILNGNHTKDEEQETEAGGEPNGMDDLFF